jgi:hypothetical protein
VARLEALARLMDGAFVVPGTSIRFGLDGITGLIPVAGDVIAGLVSTYLIWEARQLGAPNWLIARMLANYEPVGFGKLEKLLASCWELYGVGLHLRLLSEVKPARGIQNLGTRARSSRAWGADKELSQNRLGV